MSKTVPISVRLGVDLIKRLRKHASKNGLSLGGFIKHVLIKYLEDNDL